MESAGIPPGCYRRDESHPLIACWLRHSSAQEPTAPPLRSHKSLFPQDIFACRARVQTVPYAPGFVGGEVPMTELRAAIYCRQPSPTGDTDDLLASLRGVAASRGWRVVTSLADQQTGTASARSNSPGFGALLNAAARREFDVLVVESLRHLASTLPGLIRAVNELRNHGVDLLACDSDIDTTVASGKSAFTAFAALAQFERTMIRERSRISLARARRNGVRLGRPSNMNDSVHAAVQALHGRGVAIRQIARQLRIGNATVYKALQAATTHPAPKESQTSRNGFGTPQRSLERAGSRVPA